MKNLFLKILYMTTAATMTITTAHAADSIPDEILSHVVLNLPLEVKSEAPWSKIITTTREWNLFYSDLPWDDTSESPALTAPAIDFDTYQLLVGGIGSQAGGGFSILVQKVIEYVDSVLVSVLIISPGENCTVTAAITYPTVAVLIKKTSKPLQFSFSNISTDCS